MPPRAKAKPGPARVQKAPTSNKREQSQPWPRPIAGIIHGPPGSGKTGFAASFPRAKVFYHPQEAGILDLVAFGQVPKPEHEPEQINSFGELCDVGLRAGKLKNQGVMTCVFDALTGFEQMCFMEHCEKYFKGDFSKEGFQAYGNGPKNAARVDWNPRFLASLDNLLQEDINVLLIAHSQIKPYKNPLGPDHDRITPMVDKEVWAFTSAWSSSIFFYNYHYTVQTDKGGSDNSKKGKAQENISRMIFTDQSPAYEAKNRYGLDRYIDAGDSGEEAFQNFLKAFPKR
jgi:hypothetical protein